MRCDTPWRVPTLELYLVVRAGYLLPVEEHNQLLADYLTAAAQAKRQPMDMARVALVGRTKEKLDRTSEEIIEDGGAAEGYVCDIRIEDQVRETVEAIVSAHGRINGLVNNAGGQFPAPLRDISQKGWATVVRTHPIVNL